MEVWLITDETEEAISALEMLAEIIPSINFDNYRWKWAIIAIHNALQGFMVLALRERNRLIVLTKKSAKKWITVDEHNRTDPDNKLKYPEEKLDNFLNLYDKIKSDSMLFYFYSKKFKSNNEHDESVKMINNLRNEFIHFVPKGWSLELTGAPKVCLKCIEIIEFIYFESGNIFMYDNKQKERTTVALNMIKKSLTDIMQKYEIE